MYIQFDNLELFFDKVEYDPESGYINYMIDFIPTKLSCIYFKNILIQSNNINIKRYNIDDPDEMLDVINDLFYNIKISNNPIYINYNSCKIINILLNYEWVRTNNYMKQKLHEMNLSEDISKCIYIILYNLVHVTKLDTIKVVECNDYFFNLLDIIFDYN